MKKKEITGLNDIRYIGITLGGLNPDNVDYIYNKRLQFFYYKNSSQKEITDNDEGLKYDEQGNIINATFNKVYETGLQIPETTFIENELNRINKIDLTQLENSQKDLVRFYKQYLEAKQQTSEPEQSGTDNPDEVKIIDKLKQNKFDDVEPSKVYQHFKQLVDNSYITNENFNLFLSTVFEQNKTLTTKIEIIKPNSKQRVQKIFYSYYEKLVQRKYGTKPKYIDLLC